jgi:OOP family OmpA-OmpF porin
MHPTVHPRRLRCIAVVALGALASLPVWAQSGEGLRAGPYIGASVGKPDWRTDNVGSIGDGGNSGTGYKLYGGYAFSPNLALEVGGVRLGRLSGNGGEAKADGAYIDAVGLWPVNPQWALLGRLGVVNAKVSTPGGSDRGTGAKGGLGVQYNFDTHTSLRAEWERYGLNAFDQKPKVDLYSIGLNYAF